MANSSREILARLRASLPISVVLPDPITGELFTFVRDNMLATLVVDVSDLEIESQTTALLYGQTAHLLASARIAAHSADVTHRAWTARIAAQGRATLKVANGGKEPTGDAVKEFYRQHADYDREYAATNRASVRVRLFEDLLEAVKIKQRSISDLHGVHFGHNRSAGNADRLAEMAEAAVPMMAQAAAEMEARRSRVSAPQQLPLASPEIMQPPPLPPQLPNTDTTTTKRSRRNAV